MQKYTSITVRLNPDLKKQVGTVLDRLGMNHSEAINIFYNLIYLNQGLPFDVKIPDRDKLPFDLIPAIRPKGKKKRGDLS